MRGGISLWLGHTGLHWSFEEGFQVEQDKTFRLGVLTAKR